MAAAKVPLKVLLVEDEALIRWATSEVLTDAGHVVVEAPDGATAERLLNEHRGSVDVVLLDTTFWGGIRACVKAAGVCETFQLGVAVHSSGELGIQLATMLHLGAVIPNLSFAADAHYHHLTDDIIEGGKLRYDNGAIAVPATPGLGVKLDRDKVAEYRELYQRLGSYPYDQDPLRPGRTPTIPNDRWADPQDARAPEIPS